MIYEKYYKTEYAIVEDEGDTNVTKKSRRNNYLVLINKANEGDVDVISKKQKSMIQQ